FTNINGSIDDVMVFNRSLSVDEIRDLYVRGRARWNITSEKLFIGNETNFTLPRLKTNVLPILRLESPNGWYTPYLFRNMNFSFRDGTPPEIFFVSPTPPNGTSTMQNFTINVSIFDLNLRRVILEYNNTNTTFFVSNSSEITQISEGNYTFSVVRSPPAPEEFIYYRVYAVDLDNIVSTERRLIKGNGPPFLVSLNYSPTSLDFIDPNEPLYVEAIIRDNESNFQSSWLQWKNSTQNWNEIINTTQMILMSSSSLNSTHWKVNASFILPHYQGIIYFRIFKNDSLGESSNSTVFNVSSFWDCTWNMSLENGSNLGEFFGFDELKNFANFTIFNTGDVNYSDSCPLQFEVSHNLNPANSVRIGGLAGRSRTYSHINAKQNITVVLDFNFRNEIYSDFLNLTIKEKTENANPQHTDFLTAVLISTSGPYLYQKYYDPLILENPSLLVKRNLSFYEIYLSNKTIFFNSSIRNGVGDGTENRTAYNVSHIWFFDELFNFTNYTSGASNISLENTNIT
ncbi:MAG: hypothetical protein NZM44_00330, partial [Candidatus Calescibacterium sp.]|nr:hypothetical protein [Candidatus Calescibacterium sp.]